MACRLLVWVGLDQPQRNRKSIRLKDYDYSHPGSYFVTVLVRNRECLLGEVIKGEMKLSEMGKIVENVWNELPTRYPCVGLDEFVIMPNHIYGIIVITNNDVVTLPVRAIHELPLHTGSLHTGLTMPIHTGLTEQQKRRQMLLSPTLVGFGDAPCWVKTPWLATESWVQGLPWGSYH